MIHPQPFENDSSLNDVYYKEQKTGFLCGKVTKAIISFCVALSCGRALLEYNIYMIIIEVNWGATKSRGIYDVNGI